MTSIDWLRASVERWESRRRVTSDGLFRTGARPLTVLTDLVMARQFLEYDETAPPSGVIGTMDLKPLLFSGLQVEIQPGVAWMYDSGEDPADRSTQVFRPIVVADATIVTHDAHDATHPRYDIIVAAPQIDETDSATERFRPGGPGTSSLAQTTDRAYEYTANLSIVKGTPGASPSLPSIPSGKIPIAVCLVPAVSGNVSIQDARRFLEPGFGFEPIPARAPALGGIPYARPVVQWGGTVTPDSGMVLDVAQAVVDFRAKRTELRAASITIEAADGTHDRIDSIVVSCPFDGVGSTTFAGGLEYRVVKGTPAASPVPPTVSGDYLPIADVLVGTGVTSIGSGDITDRRWTGAYLDANNSVLTVDPKVSAVSAGGGSAATVTVQAKDADGNDLTTQDVWFEVELWNADAVLADPDPASLTGQSLLLTTGTLQIGSDGTTAGATRFVAKPNTAGRIIFSVINADTGSSHVVAVKTTPVVGIVDSLPVNTDPVPHLRKFSPGRSVWTQFGLAHA